MNSCADLLKRILLIVLLLTSCPVLATEPDNPYRFVKLKNWSIFYRGPHFDSGMLHRKGGIHVWYELRTPKDNRLVAIVGVGENHQPVLNPRDLLYEYGPIPPLDQLTSAQAEELWGWGDGTVIIPATSTPTFKLISREKIPFELELSFVNDKLQKYKITAERFPVRDYSCMFDPFWVEVKSDGQGTPS